MIILYSTGCPKCRVLKQKLDDKNIEYNIVDNVDEMLSLGITTVPVLKVDGKMLEFKSANEWVNER